MSSSEGPVSPQRSSVQATPRGAGPNRPDRVTTNVMNAEQRRSKCEPDLQLCCAQHKGRSGERGKRVDTRWRNRPYGRTSALDERSRRSSRPSGRHRPEGTPGFTRSLPLAPQHLIAHTAQQRIAPDLLEVWVVVGKKNIGTGKERVTEGPLHIVSHDM